MTLATLIIDWTNCLAAVILAAQPDAAPAEAANPTFWQMLQSWWAWCLAPPGRAAVGAIAAAVGVWLLVPRGQRRGRWFGAASCVAALALFVSLVPQIPDVGQQAIIGVLGFVAVAAAVATISFHSPVYSAVWFALTLLAVGGLMLCQGAQFLGVATVVVYAGAIVVTFLFVLMLAQPEGHDYYDRISWGRGPAAFSALAGAAIVAMLTLATRSLPESPGLPVAKNDVLSANHTAHLGGELFSRHLVSVELAGVLLLVALVGAISIAAARQNTPQTRSGIRENSEGPT